MDKCIQLLQITHFPISSQLMSLGKLYPKIWNPHGSRSQLSRWFPVSFKISISNVFEEFLKRLVHIRWNDVVQTHPGLNGNLNLPLSITKLHWPTTIPTVPSPLRFFLTALSRLRGAAISLIASASLPSLFTSSRSFWIWKLKFPLILSGLLWLILTSLSTTTSTW